MEQVLEALLVWIATNTGYETASIASPEVVEMTPQEITREFYTDAEHLLPEDGVDTRIRALYTPVDGANGRIYILSAEHVARETGEDYDAPLESPVFREMLLHELIHHFQHASGRAGGFPCPAYGETEAYMYGGAYLKQLNIEDTMPNRQFWAAVYSRC